MTISGFIRLTAAILLLQAVPVHASHNNRLTEQTLDGNQPIANVLRHSYDALNRLISTSDNIGPVQSMDYDANGNPIELTDALGQVTTQQFDGLDRLIRQTLPEARVVRMDYNVHGELISQTDARDFTTSFSYNTLGQQTAITQPDSSSESFEYDLVGNRTASIDANNQRSSFEYDALNRMISQTDPVDDTGNSSTQSFNYDLQGNLIRQTDRNGNVTDNTYDLENRLQTSTRADILQLTQVYDDVGNLRRSTDANNHTTVNDYDAANALIRAIRPQGAVTTLTRDALGNVVTEQRPAGRNITRSFDARGRVITETNHAQETTSFAYDDNDNVIQTTRPNGSVWQRDYDTANRLIGITDPEQNHWSYGYDQNDNRSSHTDANGHTTTQDYDNRNRLISISYPDTSTATFTYDATGNLRTSTDANAQTTTHDYDQRNRRIHTSYSGATGDAIASIDFSYDANSNLTEVELTTASGDQRTSSRQYDAFDRLEIISDRFGNTLQYAYDNNGNRKKLIDHNNRVTQYSYDELNRLRSINAPLAGQVVYGYYNNSQLRQIDWPNGIRSHYQYDGAERIASIQHQLAASSFAEAQYDYDLNGNRSQQIITQGTQSEQTSYDYDTADRLTDILEPNRSIEYTLDGVANRLTETISDNNQTTTQDKTYSYNSRDQLQQVQDAIGGALITYQYDNNGNQTQKTDASGTTNLVYGPRDRLLTITLPGAPPIQYSYNEAGLRDSQSQNGNQINYIYDQTSLIAETNTNNDEIARYTHSSLGLIAVARSGIQTYIHGDVLSTPIAITDTSGAVTTRYTWDTWGNLQQQSGFSQQPFGFTGYQRDAQTGLHYAQQRYYDSEIGRFNRHDPFRGDIDTPLSLHRYLYANANPTIFVDPTGEFPTFLNQNEIDQIKGKLLGVDVTTREGSEELRAFEAGQIKGVVSASSDAVIGTVQFAADIPGAVLERSSGFALDFGSNDRIGAQTAAVLQLASAPITTISNALSEANASIALALEEGRFGDAGEQTGRLGTNAALTLAGLPAAGKSALALSSRLNDAAKKANNAAFRVVEDGLDTGITPMLPGSLRSELSAVNLNTTAVAINTPGFVVNPGRQSAFDSSSTRQRVLSRLEESRAARPTDAFSRFIEAEKQIEIRASLESPNILFRGQNNSVSPMRILEDGFFSKGNSDDLLLHAIDSNNPPSLFVATTPSFFIASEFATRNFTRSGSVFAIRRSRGLDVNTRLGEISPSRREREVAVPILVPASDILGFMPLRSDGSFGNASIINLNYRK